MSAEVLTGVIVGLFLIYLIAKLRGGWRTYGSNRLPPSPGVGLPIIGHLYLLETNPRRQFLEWGKRYGPMISLYLGSRLAVVLYGYETIKEAFVKHAETFSDRPDTFVMQALGKDRGFVTSGQHWREQRKVTIEILRELGLGTSVMEEKIQKEISFYLDQIDKHNCSPFDPRQLTMQSVSNVICALVFGRGFQHDDPKTARLASMLGDQVSLLEGTILLNFLPFLRILPGDLFNFHKVLHLTERIENDLVRQQIQLHKEQLESAGSDDVQDFIFGYLRQIHAQTGTGMEGSVINEDNLIAVVTNLFAAGTETTSTTISWALLYFMHNPNVLERCFQEIVVHVGNNRKPTFKDRQSLKYLEATIMEVQRISSIAPFSLHHSASTDIVFMNYYIPKGTIIMPSLDSVHLSTEIWGDPQNFRPERFLDATGQNIIRKEELIPFSIGRRSCLGEALAKMELFLFLSTMIQTYHFKLPDGASLPPLKDRFGLSCSPLPYELRFVPRSN